MVIDTIALWLLLNVAATVCIWRFSRLFRPMLSAARSDSFDQPGKHLGGVLRAVGLHERLLKVRYSGVLPAMIFSAFFVLANAIVQDFGTVLFPGFSLRPIGGETWIAALHGNSMGKAARMRARWTKELPFKVKEALALGDARIFVVACPKDKVMYSAAVQAPGVQDRMEVRDLMDLIEPEVERGDVGRAAASLAQS
jgi:hypothetical protein